MIEGSDAERANDHARQRECGEQDRDAEEDHCGLGMGSRDDPCPLKVASTMPTRQDISEGVGADTNRLSWSYEQGLTDKGCHRDMTRVVTNKREKHISCQLTHSYLRVGGDPEGVGGTPISGAWLGHIRVHHLARVDREELWM